MRKTEQVLFWGMIVLLPFERLATFEFADFTVKPAYLLGVVFILVSIVRYCSKCHFQKLFSSSPRFVRTIKPEEIVLLALAAWSYLSTLWSLAPLRTLVYSSLFLMMAIIFMIIRRKVNNELIVKLKTVIINLGLALAVFAIYQLLVERWFGGSWAMLRFEYDSHVFGFARPQATFLEPLYLANFLFWPIAFELHNLVASKSKSSWKLTLLLVAFILSLSRGAYLGLAAGLIIALMLAIISKKMIWKKFLFVLGSGVIAIVISMLLILAVSGTNGIKTFANHAVRSSDLAPSTEEELLKNREVSIENAADNLQDHLWLGIGTDAFGALPEYQLLREKGDWQTVNNQYMDFAVSLGLPGLLLWIAFWLMLLKPLFLGKKIEKKYYLISITALLVQWVTFSAINLLYIWTMLAIVWPVVSARPIMHQNKTELAGGS